jgi:hypothetical protein
LLSTSSILLITGELIFSPKIVNFESFYQFYSIYNDRNVVKMTSWEMCFTACKISKIQELPLASPSGPPPGFCPGPTGGLRAAPIPLPQIGCAPLTAVPGFAPGDVQYHQYSFQNEFLSKLCFIDTMGVI